MPTLSCVEDGWSSSQGEGSHSLARADSGTHSNYTNKKEAYATIYGKFSGRGGVQYLIRRAWFIFNTSGITVTPASANLQLGGFSQTDLDVILVSASLGGTIDSYYEDITGAATALSNSDGSGAGTLAGVSGLTYSAEISTWNTGAYNTIPLNANALGKMVSETSFECILMGYDYDFLDIDAALVAGTGFEFRETTESTPSPPILNYTVATPAVDNAVFFGSNF